VPEQKGRRRAALAGGPLSAIVPSALRLGWASSRKLIIKQRLQGRSGYPTTRGGRILDFSQAPSGRKLTIGLGAGRDASSPSHGGAGGFGGACCRQAAVMVHRRTELLGPPFGARWRWGPAAPGERLVRKALRRRPVSGVFAGPHSRSGRKIRRGPRREAIEQGLKQGIYHAGRPFETLGEEEVSFSADSGFQRPRSQIV